MKKNNIHFWSAAAIFLFMAACAAPAADKSQPAALAAAQADIYGVYEGVLPAADCPGIYTVLTLQEDGTFTKVSQYLEREGHYTEEGVFVLEEGKVKTTDKTGEVYYYLPGAGRLQQLDREAQPIGGEMGSLYILKKR